MKSQKRPEPQLPFYHRNFNCYDDQNKPHIGPAVKTNTSSSNKIGRSPYLQKVSHVFSLPKKLTHSREAVHNFHQSSKIGNEGDDSRVFEESGNKYGVPKKRDTNEHPDYLRSKSNLATYSEQREKNTKFRLPKIDVQYIQTEKKQKSSSNTILTTLDATAKKKKLIPLQQVPQKPTFVIKTKAGTNGLQTKINQDIAIVESFQHGVKLYCVCDGHGLNGHKVSAFIKQKLIQNVATALRKYDDNTNIEKLFERSLALTNEELLNSDINTDLSGSTVIAVFIHKEIIYSFNVGDSRAILISENPQDNWKITPLSTDQKPSREDEKQRIIKLGGRIDAQRNERGQPVGPLRVWMKDIQMPGLAMTRSFGDKAGIKAGTNAEPEILIKTIQPSDRFMIIASDGVWEYLENEQILDIGLPFYKKNDIAMAADKILRISVQIWQKISYSRDDITLIIVHLNPANEITVQQTRTEQQN